MRHRLLADTISGPPNSTPSDAIFVMCWKLNAARWMRSRWWSIKSQWPRPRTWFVHRSWHWRMDVHHSKWRASVRPGEFGSSFPKTRAKIQRCDSLLYADMELRTLVAQLHLCSVWREVLLRRGGEIAISNGGRLQIGMRHFQSDQQSHLNGQTI